jgi:hypothetical protein
VSSTRKIALVSGIFFVITFVTSVPALFLYSPVLNNPDYIVGAAADTRVLWGAFLEVILAIANIGTAGTLFRSSSGRTKQSQLAMSPLVSLNPPSSSSASSASFRS